MPLTTETIEQNRLVIQQEIDQRKTQAQRNKLGQFATPPGLALEIAQFAKQLVDGDPIHFADPAVGTGSFFSALLKTFPKDQVVEAIGVEIDPLFARAASKLWQDFDLTVVENDFTYPLTLSLYRNRINLLLTNPPYIRHHHLSQTQKQNLKRLVQQEIGLSVNGLAGFYVYYLLLAHIWLTDGALSTWLIPSEFMDVNYGEVLKQYLTEKVTLLAIHRFDPSEVQFDDCLVSSAVVVFKNALPMPGSPARFTYGGTLSNPDFAENVPLANLRHSRKWTAYPSRRETIRPKDDGQLLLGDLFKIQRGIATGDNGFFILERHEAEKMGIPTECVRPILPPPRQFRQEVIERESDGYPKITPQLVLINPKASSEEELQVKFPTLWNYLQTAKERGLLDRYLVRTRQPWFKQEDRRPSPFLCTYMGRSRSGKKPFRFLWNHSEAIAANVYHMLYPKEPFASAMQSNPSLQEALFDLLKSIEGQDLKQEGRVYGGGLHKIEPSELSRIPVGSFLKQVPELGNLLLM